MKNKAKDDDDEEEKKVVMKGARTDTRKYFAEMLGTFALVFFGCGSAVLAGAHIGFYGIAFAFGLTVPSWSMPSGPYRVVTSTRPSRWPCWPPGRSR